LRARRLPPSCPRAFAFLQDHEPTPVNRNTAVLKLIEDNRIPSTYRRTVYGVAVVRTVRSPRLPFNPSSPLATTYALLNPPLLLSLCPQAIRQLTLLMSTLPRYLNLRRMSTRPLRGRIWERIHSVRHSRVSSRLMTSWESSEHKRRNSMKSTRAMKS
jgi:hypothetical protein